MGRRADKERRPGVPVPSAVKWKPWRSPFFGWINMLQTNSTTELLEPRSDRVTETWLESPEDSASWAGRRPALDELRPRAWDDEEDDLLDDDDDEEEDDAFAEDDDEDEFDDDDEDEDEEEEEEEE